MGTMDKEGVLVDKGGTVDQERVLWIKRGYYG